MQNLIPKFGQSSSISEKLSNLKLQVPYSIFFAETLHAFPTKKCLQTLVWYYFYFV